MRIDAHQHFWEYDPAEYSWIDDSMTALKRDILPADLYPHLKEKAFDGCVSVQARQTEGETDFLLRLAAENDFVKAVIGWVDFRADTIEERLEYYLKFPKLKGFRHIVQDEPDDRFLLNKKFINGIKLCKTYDLTYDILIYERHLPVVVKFLEHFDNQPFVLDHMAKPVIAGGMTKNWRDGIRAIAQYPNLYCKLSGLVTEADWNHWHADDFKPFLDEAVDAFGIDRIMVGSDYPVCLLAAESYGQVIDLAASYFSGFSGVEKSRIFGKNAIDFYNID